MRSINLHFTYFTYCRKLCQLTQTQNWPGRSCSGPADRKRQRWRPQPTASCPPPQPPVHFHSHSTRQMMNLLLLNVSGQLYTFAFISVRIICFMSGGIYFISYNIRLFIFLLPDTDVIMSLLQYLFVALIIPFSYEDKRLAQHWTMHSWCIHWPVAFMTQNTWFVPKVNILNTWRKLAHLEKQRIASLMNIYHNRFSSLWTELTVL